MGQIPSQVSHPKGLIPWEFHVLGQAWGSFATEFAIHKLKRDTSSACNNQNCQMVPNLGNIA